MNKYYISILPANNNILVILTDQDATPSSLDKSDYLLGLSEKYFLPGSYIMTCKYVAAPQFNMRPVNQEAARTATISHFRPNTSLTGDYHIKIVQIFIFCCLQLWDFYKPNVPDDCNDSYVVYIHRLPYVYLWRQPLKHFWGTVSV